MQPEIKYWSIGFHVNAQNEKLASHDRYIELKTNGYPSKTAIHNKLLCELGYFADITIFKMDEWTKERYDAWHGDVTLNNNVDTFTTTTTTTMADHGINQISNNSIPMISSMESENDIGYRKLLDVKYYNNTPVVGVRNLDQPPLDQRISDILSIKPGSTNTEIRYELNKSKCFPCGITKNMVNSTLNQMKIHGVLKFESMGNYKKWYLS